jgi:hypothetical protein
MRYVREQDARAIKDVLDRVGSISVTGSVLGMRRLYGWKKGGQVRVGAYIYNVGPAEVTRFRALGILRGEG